MTKQLNRNELKSQDGKTVETVSDFILGGSKITADGDCSHEIKMLSNESTLRMRWPKYWSCLNYPTFKNSELSHSNNSSGAIITIAVLITFLALF